MHVCINVYVMFVCVCIHAYILTFIPNTYIHDIYIHAYVH